MEMTSNFRPLCIDSILMLIKWTRRGSSFLHNKSSERTRWWGGELHMNCHSLCLHTFAPLSCRPQVFQLDAIDAAMCEVMFDGAGLDGAKARNTACDWWHHLAHARLFSMHMQITLRLSARAPEDWLPYNYQKATCAACFGPRSCFCIYTAVKWYTWKGCINSILSLIPEMLPFQTGTTV